MVLCASMRHFIQMVEAGGPWSGSEFVVTHRYRDRERLRGILTHRDRDRDREGLLTHRDRSGMASVTAGTVK